MPSRIRDNIIQSQSLVKGIEIAVLQEDLAEQSMSSPSNPPFRLLYLGGSSIEMRKG
jgi:hypothetical protein